MQHYNVGYSLLPRHLVDIYGKKNTFNIPTKFKPSDKYKPKDELIYIFKSSYREDYHRELLDMLALPKGHLYRLEYDIPWLQDDLWKYIKMRPHNYYGKEALLCYLDLDATTKTVIPLRKLKIKRIEVKGEILVLHVEVGSYACPPSNQPELFKDFRSKLESFLGKVPMGGTPLNKLIFLAERIPELEQLQDNDDLLAWKKVIDQLYNNKCVKFDKSLFYRIRVDKIDPITDNNENPTTVYELDGGKNVSFHVDYYLPNYNRFPRSDIDARTITFESTCEAMKAVIPTQFICSKYGSDKIVFSTSQLPETRTCTVQFRSFTSPFEAPMLDIPIRIKGAGSKIAATRAASAVSSGLGGGSAAAFVPLLVSGTIDAWPWIWLFIFGVILLGCGAWLGTKYAKS